MRTPPAQSNSNETTGATHVTVRLQRGPGAGTSDAVFPPMSPAARPPTSSSTARATAPSPPVWSEKKLFASAATSTSSTPFAPASTLLSPLREATAADSLRGLPAAIRPELVVVLRGGLAYARRVGGASGGVRGNSGQDHPEPNLPGFSPNGPAIASPLRTPAEVAASRARRSAKTSRMRRDADP